MYIIIPALYHFFIKTNRRQSKKREREKNVSFKYAVAAHKLGMVEDAEGGRISDSYGAS